MATGPTVIGPYPLAGVGMGTWLLRFDERGDCKSVETRAALLDHLQTHPYADIILFSHGWNNDFDAATALYRDFLMNFEAVRPAAATASSLFIGITWPSTWLVFGDGPTIAGADEPGFKTVREDLIDAMGPAAAAEATSWLARPEVTSGEARRLADLVAPVLSRLARDEAYALAPTMTADDVLSIVAALESVSRRSAVPENLDDYGATGGVGGGPEAAGLLDRLDPRNVVRLASLYQMKDRAGAVGTNGMAPLMRDVLQASSAKVHAVGHSFGCKVMLSAVCAPTAMPRPLASLLLLQPAISHLCFSERVPGTDRPGGYRAALDRTRVMPPIVSTYSKEDFPLHATFHLAVRRAGDLGEAVIAAAAESTTAGAPPSKFAALGGYGPRGTRQRLLDPMPKPGTDYPFAAAADVLAVDGSQGRITGHGDVRTPYTAWALHQLASRVA